MKTKNQVKKTAYLLHNTNAGKGHEADDIKKIITAAGFSCIDCELEDTAWRNNADDQCLVIAGGDGTVRKVVETILPDQQLQPLIALLPIGTANNISNTLRDSMVLEAEKDLQQIAGDWQLAEPIRFDVGWLSGDGLSLDLKTPAFFLESVGCGLFPALMKSMKAIDKLLFDAPLERIDAALVMLLKLIEDCAESPLKIEVDGQTLQGEYISVEIMNIRSLGPNLELAPEALPGDGLLDLVLIEGKDRERLANYVQNKLARKHEPFPFTVLKAKAITLHTQADTFHIDDELFEISESSQLSLSIEPQRLRFIS